MSNPPVARGDYVVFSHSDKGGCRRDGHGGATVLNGKTYLTPEGGMAFKMTAGELLVRGEIVYINATAEPFQAWKVPANGDMPVASVWDASASAGNPVWVVHAGVGYVRPAPNASATQGHIIACSSTRGRGVGSATIPSVEVHNREVGHYLENGTANNEPALAILHFN